MILAVLALALLVRLPALFSAAPLGDEYMQFYFALGKPGLGEFLGAVRHNPHHMLLDPLLTWLFARLGGEAAWLRAPSLLWGLAAVEGIRRLGERAGGPRLGLLAAAALAVSGMHAEWSVRASFYAALSAFAVWQTVLLLEVESSPRKWGAYALCAAAFLHTHPYAVFVAALHGAALASPLRRGALKSWALAWIAAGAVFLPWFWWSTRHAVRSGALAFWSEPVAGVLRFLAALPLHFTTLSEAAPAAFGASRALQLLLAAAALGLWVLSRVPGHHRPESPALSAARLLVPAGLLLVLASDRALNMYLAPRQLIWLLPFFLLEAAAGAARLAPLLPRGAAVAAGALILAVSLGLRASAVSAQARDGAQFKRVTAEAARLCLPGDAFVFDDDLAAHAFLYRFDREAFARAPAFRELPADFSARCAGGSAAFTVGEPPRGRPAWSVRGRLENFTAAPPPGRPS